MGYKIFTHESHSIYVGRTDTFQSYDTISKDIIQRWAYPLVLDAMFFGNSATILERPGMYQASEVGQSRSVQIGPFTVIGEGTAIGNNTSISNSVVGQGCIIGSDVLIEGSYVWDNVIIENGCKLSHAIASDGVIMKSGAVLEPSVVLSFKVVIGQQFVVPPYSKVYLFQQPTKQDSEEGLEYADNSSGIVEIPVDNSDEEIKSELLETQCWPTSLLGAGGVGYTWSISEGDHDEEWRHSVDPNHAEELGEATDSMDDDMEIAPDGGILPPFEDLNLVLEDDNNEGVGDELIDFDIAVEETFRRAVFENIEVDNVILEVDSLRYGIVAH
ncbi:UDP-3-O-[3-hydroxymyristoyl] glucosamine N-acyltransferase LpxD [Trema orientale]|uniref:UDP-3-O-[3-hydroxymyristoyl] glucosamine N-acyltransferase LpxD n=1 Tax=Trema orientale TaxID=63057 RepID=A0A2P5E812_TREOI|nr:UDP-3-O-[3-hydroxymyristoyl] glucosamine N-acyltransferase LpxD [Trema orientale]